MQVFLAEAIISRRNHLDHRCLADKAHFRADFLLYLTEMR